MSKLGKLQLIRISQELVAGTAVAGATELMVYDPELARDDNYIARENAAIGVGGAFPGERGPSTGRCPLKFHLRSDGVDTLEAGALIAMQACGLALAAGVLTPVTAIANQKTATVDHWADGVKQRLFGAMGDWEIAGEFGKPVMVTCTLSGLYSWLGAEAVPAAVLSSRRAFRAESVTLTLDGVALACSKFAIKANNPVEAREDLAAPDGIAHYMVGAGRRITVTLDPEVVAPATLDPATLSDGGTLAELVVVLSDGDVTLTINAPAVEILPPNLGRRGEKLVWNELTGVCTITSGDDEISLTLAAVP